MCMRYATFFIFVVFIYYLSPIGSRYFSLENLINISILISMNFLLGRSGTYNKSIAIM